MQNVRNDHPGGVIVTAYVPIFRDKLDKLERNGRGDSVEAVRLRRTLASVDYAMTGSSLEDGDQRYLVAAE